MQTNKTNPAVQGGGPANPPTRENTEVMESEETLTAMMNIIHHGNVLDEGTDDYETETEVSTQRKKEKEEAQRKRDEEEQEECIRWLNMYGKAYISPTPKYLLIEDVGRRRFSKEDVIKRTAWLGMALDITPGNKDQIPVMKRITIKDESYISVKTEIPATANKLLTLRKIGPCQVQVTKDAIKNSSHGLILDWDKFLERKTEDTIKELFEQQGVTKVVRFTKGPKGSKTPNGIYKLTFDTLNCPEKVDTDGRWYWVRVYVDPPRRCFKCQTYKHAKKSCRRDTYVCQRCGQEGHESKVYDEQGNIAEQCHNAVKCVHCEGNHEAGSKICPVYIKHKEVNELIIKQQLTRREAEDRIFPEKTRRTNAQAVVAGNQLQETTNQALQQMSANQEQTVETLSSRIMENNTNITALHRKFDLILTKVTTPEATLTQGQDQTGSLISEADVQQNKLTEFIAKQEEQNRTFQAQIAKQNQEIGNLNKINKELSDQLKEKTAEVKTLQKELNSEKAIVKDLRKQLDSNKKRKADDTTHSSQERLTKTPNVQPKQTNPNLRSSQNAKNSTKTKPHGSSNSHLHKPP